MKNLHNFKDLGIILHTFFMSAEKPASFLIDGISVPFYLFFFVLFSSLIFFFFFFFAFLGSFSFLFCLFCFFVCLFLWKTQNVYKIILIYLNGQYFL